MFHNMVDHQEMMMRLFFCSTLVLGLMLPATLACGAPTQRVYVRPQNIWLVNGAPVVIPAECADQHVRLMPDLMDEISVFSDPREVFFEKFQGDVLIGTQCWADVVDKKQKPWVRISGASSRSSVKLRFQVTKPEQGVRYRVRFKKAMIAARAEEGLAPKGNGFTVDLMGKLKRSQDALNQLNELRNEVSVFEANSPIRRQVDAYAQKVVWTIAEEANHPVEIEKQTRQILDKMLDLLRLDNGSPLHRQLAATFLGGPIRAGSEQEKFFGRHWAPLTIVELPRELERAVLNLRDSFGWSSPKLNGALDLLAKWHEAGIPAGDGRNIRVSLEVLQRPRFGCEAGANGAVLTTGELRLSVGDLQAAIDACSGALRTRDALGKMEIELVRLWRNSLLTRDANMRVGRSLDTLRGVIKRAKAASGVFNDATLQDLDRLAFDLFKTAQSVREAKLAMPPMLGEIERQFGLESLEWAELLTGNHLVSINGLGDEQMQKLARELAELEVSTGLTFTLAFTKSPELRAAALYNGGRLAVTADESLKAIDVPALGDSLFRYLSALAEVLKKEGEIQIFVAHTKGKESYEAWMKMATGKELARKHWIFAPCPPEQIAQQHGLARAALNNKDGGVLSIVMANRAVSPLAFTMAVRSIVRMGQAERRGIPPIVLIRNGLIDSWHRLDRCLSFEGDKRDVEIRREFGNELGPAIIRELKRVGKDEFARTLWDQARYYNGVVFRSETRRLGLAC